MNTNAGSSSMGRTDSSTQDWSNNLIPIALYQNIDHDQVDWGALAQQWIQMREQWSQPATGSIPSPPPPPSFSDNSEPYPPSQGFDSAESMLPYDAEQQSNVVSTLSEYEEQGEAPMEVEWEEDNPTTSSPLRSSPSVAGQPIVNPNATAAVANWQAKINQLYQMDHRTVRHPQRYSESAIDVRESVKAALAMENKSKRLLGLMDREIELGAPCVAGPTLNGSKDNCSSGSVMMNEAKRKLLPAWIREGLEKMEREKQRQIEREQERLLWEEEQKRQLNLEDGWPESWSPEEIDESPTSDNKLTPEIKPAQPDASTTQAVPSPVLEAGNDHKEDFFEALSISVRKILTEILMEVTGDALSSIAKESLAKVNRRKGELVQQSVQTKTGLATCIGGLGLGIYGDSDEEDEEEQQDDSSQSKKTATKAADSASDTDSTESDVSDSTAEQKLQEKIRRRQLAFEPAAREIEQWHATTMQYLKEKHGFEPYGSKPQLFRRPECDVRAYESNADKDDSEDDGDDDSNGDDGDDDLELTDGRCETKVGQLGKSCQAGDTSGNGYGNAGAKSVVAHFSSTRDGETQPLNDKLYASQQFAGGRKRRDKRISRFSVLQEPRAQLSSSLTAPPVPVAMTYKLGSVVQADPSRSRLGEAGLSPSPDAPPKGNHISGQLKQNQHQRIADAVLEMVRPAGTGTAPTIPSNEGEAVTSGAARGTSRVDRNLEKYLGPSSNLTKDGQLSNVATIGESSGNQDGSTDEPGEDEEARTMPPSASPLDKGHSQRKPSPRDGSSDQRKSSHRHQRDRSEKFARTSDTGRNRHHHRTRHHRDHRHRSPSKSSRSRSRSAHSVSPSTRSRSSRSRSRSLSRKSSTSRSNRAATSSSSRHRNRSERARRRSSRSRSRTRSRSCSRSRSRSSGQVRSSSSSKYSSRRRY